MKELLPSDRLEKLIEYAGSALINRTDESRNFFVALGERRYFLTFHWLDQRKVSIYASADDFIVATDSQSAAQSFRDVDVEGDSL